jgi:predicted CXXCH cytochrome family protein
VKDTAGTLTYSKKNSSPAQPPARFDRLSKKESPRAAAIAGGALDLFRPVILGLIAGCWIAGGIALGLGVPVQGGQSEPVADPNAACAPCHREIYERYRKTPMANASGPAENGLIPADFEHTASGVHYKVFAQGAQAWLSYEREGAPAGRELNGREPLRYFLGSGKRGRTYLFERQGYWFESPINWYAKKQMWDMAPNYLSAHEAPLTLPVDPGCLHCHFTGADRALKDARNHYAGEPFASVGITCAACHGDPAAHLASGGKVHMAEIDRMEPVRRDSVCLNCHLEGQAAVVREGKEIESFVPGDNLFEFALFFVRAGEDGSGGRATSQWEALLKSQCKQKSGDKLTCTTCHDPHGSPSPDERVAFYRQRCLQCHQQAGFAASHHPENADCTACHMARPPSNDIAHEQVTDHWIRKRVSEERLPLATTGALIVVGGFAAGDRDLGLAYAQMAARGDRQAGERALELLRSAERQTGGAVQDHELHAQLGFLNQLSGEKEAAADEYQKALEADPYDSLAAGNLALIAAQQHQVAEAAGLWNSVFNHDPVEVGAGLNLAVVECEAGQRDASLATLTRVLSFAPDNGRARSMLGAIRSGQQSCGSGASAGAGQPGH